MWLIVQPTQRSCARTGTGTGTLRGFGGLRFASVNLLTVRAMYCVYCTSIHSNIRIDNSVA